MGIASDQLAQITNAWAANPDVRCLLFFCRTQADSLLQNYVIPCNTTFDLIFQFAGNNFTLSKEDTLVPSEAAIDSGNYGGYATTDCQAQMQPFTPTANEIGDDTSQTYQLGDVFMRNVITGEFHGCLCYRLKLISVAVFDYGSLTNAASQPPRIGFRSTTSSSG